MLTFLDSNIGSEEMIPSQIARNIGLVMDTGLTFSTHVYLHFRTFSQIVSPQW